MATASEDSFPKGEIDKGIAHKAIKKNSSMLKESGVRPRELAIKLYKNELISAEVYRKAIMEGACASDEERLKILASEIQDNALVKNGYFEEVVKCLHSFKDEKMTHLARAYIDTYVEILKIRESIVIGVKERGSDGARFMKRKFNQLKEGIFTLGYKVGSFFGKDIEEVTIENDLDDNAETENQEVTIQNLTVEETKEDFEATLCLSCGELITLEEEPVHDKCLENYPWCLRCGVNPRNDTDTQCAQCLMYQQVCLCHHCLKETKVLPVHLSCLPNFDLCIRCLIDDRDKPNLLCVDCNQSNQAVPVEESIKVCLVCGDILTSGHLLVHEKCLPEYPWCFNCNENHRLFPDLYCQQCTETEDETAVEGIPSHTETVTFCSGSNYDLSLDVQISDVSSSNDQQIVMSDYSELVHNDFDSIVLPVLPSEVNDTIVGNDLDSIIDPLTVVTADISVMNNLIDYQLEEIDYGSILDEALAEGHLIKVRWTKLAISGPPGSGKSSALRLLLSEPPLLTHNSTSVIAAPEVRAVSSNLLSTTEENGHCTWDTVDIKIVLANAIKNDDVHPVPTTPTAAPTTTVTASAIPPSSLHSTLPDRNEIVFDSFIEGQEMTRNIFFERRTDDTVSSDNQPASPLVESPVVKEMKDILNSPAHCVPAPPRIYHFILTVDTGGQAAFLDIAPALLRYNSVNIVTHKLDERLNDKVKFFYSLDGEMIGEPEERQLTHQQLLISSLRSLASINPPEIKGINIKYSNQKPTLIVLGTFYDKYKGQESLEKKEQLLKANMTQFNDCIAKRNGRCIFPVNTIARDDRQTKMAEIIRERVCQSYIEADVPLKWFLFRLELQNVNQSGICAIRKSPKCFQIGASLKMTRNEIETALKYYHELTVILYLPKILHNVIFLHPQPLFNKLTELIVVTFPKGREYFEKNGIKLFDEDIEEFQKQGVFTIDLVKEVCDFNDELFTADEFIRLLESLLIIAETKDRHHSYFLPSVLPTISTDDEEYRDLQATYMTELDPVIFSWKKTGITPQGLFPALIVDLLGFQPIAQFVLKYNEQQYRNAIQLDCISHGGSVLIVDNVLTMELYYISMALQSSERYNCGYVRDAIFDGIEKVVRHLKYDIALAEPDVLFYCTKHKAVDQHLCTSVRRHLDTTMLSCLRYENTQFPVDRARQKPWLQQTDLTIDHLIDVISEIREIHFSIPHWSALGLELGLLQPTLETIEADYPRDNERCLRTCLSKWLKKADRVHRRTWTVLGQALKNIGQGYL